MPLLTEVGGWVAAWLQICRTHGASLRSGGHLFTVFATPCWVRDKVALR